VSGLVLTLNIEEMYGLAFLQKVQSYDFGLVGGLLDLVLPALELVLGATWFTLSSLVDTVTNVIQGIPLAGDLLQPMLDLIDSLFTAQVWNYTVSGNTLTLQSGLITVVYTK
jgi:hypothetical protein